MTCGPERATAGARRRDARSHGKRKIKGGTHCTACVIWVCARCEGGLCAVQALHARLLPEAGLSVGARAACGARSRPDGASRQLAVCECATG